MLVNRLRILIRRARGGSKLRAKQPHEADAPTRYDARYAARAERIEPPT